jgi:selenocysteine lyase/cysteine desulfurase
MGYVEDVKTGEQSLWSRYRDFFPVAENLVYLNHAGVAPLSKLAAEAMSHLTEDVLRHGSVHYDEWLATYDGLRTVAARMVGAGPAEIAIVKNTSEGIATIAAGIDWKPGDKIVAFEEEFAANYFPWKNLEAKGVKVEWLSVFDPLGKVDQACRGARLLAISHVQYLSGFRADLVTLGEICQRRNVLFFVDAIQSLGAFPIDVRMTRIHALAADGHKWLLGPEGCGILYIHEDLWAQVEPREIGWTNFAGFNDYGSRSMAFRPNAARYECGTLNTVGCYGLRASIELLLRIGIDRIALAVQLLGDQIALGVVTKGYQVLGTRTRNNGAGIVSFRRNDIDSRAVVFQLGEKGFAAAARQGWIRCSPHFYISPDDIDRLIEALP